MVERPKHISVRMADEEREMLREIAEHVGLTASDVLRQYIRRRHAELFGKRRR